MRHISDGGFKGKFFLYTHLETTTTAHDVCDTVGSYMKVCGVCMDGAPAMLVCRSDFNVWY